MRSLLLASLLAVMLATVVAASSSDAASLPPAGAATSIATQQVDDNDDTRVEVQLVVLGIAAFTVVGVGSAAYLLRKKLGLVKGPPDQSAAGHGHH